MNAITSFRDEHYFLSNMFPSTISFEGLTYPSAESAFQAAKCLDPNDRIPFTKLNGLRSEKAGTESRAARRLGIRKTGHHVPDPEGKIQPAGIQNTAASYR